MSAPKFTVDTHLFRELGELLVGRDSTALVELLKNSYDADATSVTVYGERLQNTKSGLIRVSDNGNGMTAETFQSSFLRIASRSKDVKAPLSPRYKRHFTGAKGIGRLAAHKLAHVMEIESVYADTKTWQAVSGFRATINWETIESVETLDLVPRQAITIAQFDVRSTDKCGTTITLKKLKTQWTERERQLFTQEASSSQIPKILSAKLPDSVLEQKLLFESPTWASTGATDNNCQIKLEGEFAVGDEYLTAAAGAATWILEVEANQKHVRAAVSPTRGYQGSNANSKRVIRDLTGVVRDEFSPSFQARILIREGDWMPGSTAAKSWRNSEASGVRIYLEGFRVLPYGESGNDWLRIDSTYAKRARGDDGLAKGLFDEDELGKNTYLSYLPVRQYLGGAFLTLDHAKGLKMVVSREGFIPNSAFHYLDDVITGAINFSVVERSKARSEITDERRQSRLASAASKFQSSRTPTNILDKSLDSTTKLVKEVSAAVEVGDLTKAKPLIAQIEQSMKDKSQLVGDVRDEQAMIRILASLGTHTAGFVHELKGLLGLAASIEQQLSKVDEDTVELSSVNRKRLKQAIMALRELRIGLEGQAIYVTGFSSADSRRRRSRHDIAAVFELALGGYGQQIAARGCTVINELAPDLKSPPMFKAELLAVFSNLLSNALKAIDRGGKIRVTGTKRDRDSTIRLDNTGTAVDVANSEQWFRPFATSSTDSSPDLGNGMGLGLTITRRMLEQYGSSIQFVKPRPPYSTCVEIEFHG